LKLERTQDNLDRARDVEREARLRLRPLKRQAQAAEIHARLEREGMELRARLLAEELRSQDEVLSGRERDATKARETRDAIEAKLAEVNKERTAIEARLAERDRERTLVWGRLTAIRASHERLAVRAESLASRRAELAAGIERRRFALGELAAEAAARGNEADQLEAEMRAVGEALSESSGALERALENAEVDARARELARVREGSERAARGARRAEGLLGRGRQDSLERRVEFEGLLLEALGELVDAAGSAREALGARVATMERDLLGGEQASDDVTEQLRACSRRDAELQAELRVAAEAVTQAEVGATQERDRRAEAAAELGRISERLGEELAPAGDALGDSEREEIERKLERLQRRREQLGPVNPLAKNEYAEALAHVSELEDTREDLETAMAELQKLIRETDRRIQSAFEETFEATERNFEELVEHLFPGGRGKLRLVEDSQTPRPVLGGQEPPSDASEEASGPASPEAPEPDEAEDEPDDSRGVEIEVTPAGKATRRLSLLSGGEKSLVALAFVFAVFLARPSPFYILDEVEAALDDANIDRFLQLVRRFSDRAQFVIVTHQKRTMDAADVLYGVSMGEGGVTKVISRRLPQEDQPTLAEAPSEEEAEAA
jgi:chromosome segregation protein